ncbi:hypothetical protein GCM10023231_01120 [Olivibacter ginsenosidimutans]|uniref:Twin-arginine translocation signal domain-containing protein n=1 Tax=Olivibacter ginsenosidimutans TaxID=1176537 RepID=A0ABP9AC12_9SPHI
MLDRRGFLKASGLGMLGVGLMGGIPAFLAEAVAADKKTGPFIRKRLSYM